MTFEVLKPEESGEENLPVEGEMPIESPRIQPELTPEQKKDLRKLLAEMRNGDEFEEEAA